MSQSMASEEYYIAAFNEISDMLSGRDSLSVKRSTFLAEWAYYEGNLDYNKDFCEEIKRIADWITLLYNVNNLSMYETGKQIAMNEYFFNPYSGNNYTPYTYDFENFSFEEQNWETQFVHKLLKTHKGQCRSLPWAYKIIANEIGADVQIALAPGHCYIMYKDADNFTPEEWINLELTTHRMTPSYYIKKDFEICDSAIIVGTYMTPLNDRETVACQLGDLAFGYFKKFKRYDEFTYYCSSRSLEFFPMNPNAWIIRSKSLLSILNRYLEKYGYVIDNYTNIIVTLLEETKIGLERTFMKEEDEESREHRREQYLEITKQFLN